MVLNGVLEATVVEGDVPLLLPVKMMKQLKAIIDFSKGIFTITSESIEVPMFELPSGHVTIDILNFADTGFEVSDPDAPCSTSDFQLHVSARAMLAQLGIKKGAAPSLSFPQNSPLSLLGEHGELSAAADGWAARGGDLRADVWKSAKSPASEGGTTWMASGDGQDRHHHAIRGSAIGRAGVVPRLLWTFGAAYAAVQGARDGRGCVRPADRWGGGVASVEEPREAIYSSQLLHSPEECSERRWKQERIVHLLQDVHEPLVQSNDGGRDTCRLERAEEAGPLESKEGGSEEGACSRGCRDVGAALWRGGDCQSSDGASSRPIGEDAAPDADRDREDAGGASRDVAGASVPKTGVQGERGSASKGTTRHASGEGGFGEATSSNESSSSSSAGQAVLVREVSGEVSGPQRGSTSRKEVLEVHSERMPVLRVGAENSEPTTEPDEWVLSGHIPEDRRTDERGIFQEEEQESQNSTSHSCSRTSGGDDLRLSQETWLYATAVKGQRTLNRVLRGHDPHFAASSFQYEKEETEGDWKVMSGQIPSQEGVSVRVKVVLQKRAEAENFFGLEKEKQFNRKQRKMMNRAFEAVTPVVSEVFSPPRVVEEARRQGLQPGTSFDITEGWDLSKPEIRKKMWRKLKEEDPLLIILSPPCVGFSILQELNLPHMSWEDAVMLISTGLDHLELAMLIAKWQAKRGRYVLFEHPWLARSWHEESVKEVEQMAGMHRVRCDQCMYGLRVDEWGLNMKPTGIMVNSEKIAARMNRTCDHRHFHAPTMNGRPKKAQVYPKEFCKQIILGLKEQMEVDGKLRLKSEVFVEDEDEENSDHEEDPNPEAAAGEAEGDYSISEEEKRQVQKMHRSLGHPQKPEFVRFMRAARVKGEVIRWAAHEFKCPACEARPKPKATRPAAIPRTYQPNRVLGVDLIFLPEVGGKETFPALSILDWGSNYQVVERVENKHPDTVWNTMWSCWFRTFGWPDVIVCDAGKEFSRKFMQLATSCGIVVQPIAAKAPWQQGRTERHGALFKELLAKGREETVISSPEELRRLMQETEMAKNRFSNRSGYSPIQRQIGQWPKVPSELLSDDVIDPGLMDGAVVDDMERSLELRRIAQKAFIEHNARESLRRIEKGRSRVPQEFQAGDYVYVYRVAREKKRKHEIGPRSQEHVPNKASWIGPGTIVAVDGASLWISMFGELWRTAREQCRTATNIEKQGIEEVMRSCKELVEEYKRSSNRKGYRDIRDERWPSDDEIEDGSEESPRKREVRFQEPLEEGEAPVSEGYAPTTPIDSPRGGEIENGETEDSEMSHRRSERTDETIEEPEREARRRSSLTESEIREALRPEEETADRPETEEGDERYQRIVEESIHRSRRLEGLPAIGQPLRVRSRPSADGPYFQETFFISPEEEEDWQEEEEDREDHMRWQKLCKMSQEEPKRDYWELDLKGQKMIRHHVQKRKALFSPEGVKSTPVKLNQMQQQRITIVDGRKNQEERRIEDQWAQGDAKRSRGVWWTGRTEFFLCSKSEGKTEESIETWAVEKKGTEDVDLRTETPEALEGWKMADATEWEKISKSGAVRVLSVEESREVKKKLASEGKLDRILPTRMLRQYKHAEQPNEPPSQKSRLCIRGDKDPDIFDLERFSPTVCTMNLNVVLQLAVNEGMQIGIGDLKNAFCQSQPLMRKNGALYFKQPQEGITGLHPEQIVLIIAGCYGLVDGPLHWRKSLVQTLKMLGYQESKLDPCLFKLFESGKLCGLLAIEVDDILACGKGLHLKKIEELKTLYNFGKWVDLRDSTQGASFNGRRLRVGSKGEILIDMCKFIQERLHEIPLDKGRRSSKKEPVTETERTQARALCGSLNWLSKEGRPDAAGPSSLMSSRLTRMTVEDLIQLNEVVRGLKETAEVTLQVQPLKEMQLAVITDASFGNDGFHSQGGQMILAHEPGLKKGQKVKTNLLWWRSAKLQRVVNSTLAAETQSLSKGIGDLLWMKVLIRELSEEKFNIKEWPAQLASERVLALAKDTSSQELQECLAIVDAKSLFDHLSKESIGGQDKRTAIEIQIIRQELAQMHGEVRWIDHPAMLADPLTKVRGSTKALHDMLSSGAFGIVAEVDHMAHRKEIKASKVNRKLGSCGSSMDCGSKH